MKTMRTLGNFSKLSRCHCLPVCHYQIWTCEPYTAFVWILTACAIFFIDGLYVFMWSRKGHVFGLLKKKSTSFQPTGLRTLLRAYWQLRNNFEETGTRKTSKQVQLPNRVAGTYHADTCILTPCLYHTYPFALLVSFCGPFSATWVMPDAQRSSVGVG